MTDSTPFEIDLVGPILKDFLRKLAYEPPTFSMTNVALEEAMQNEMVTQNIQRPQLERTLHLAASLIEVSYHDCPPEDKKVIALFNWYSIYADDMASRSEDTSSLREFQHRFLCGLPQLHPVLQAYAGVLVKMYDVFDTPTANAIVTAAFKFTNYTYLEPGISTLPMVRSATRFPWFLRDATGVSFPYALFIFPKKFGMDAAFYIQALPEMNFWINATSDIMSFYKEELAGDVENYVHNLARVEGKTIAQVLVEVEAELYVTHTAIVDVLKGAPRVLDSWLQFERGYIAWHLNQDRYKLSDLIL